MSSDESDYSSSDESSQQEKKKPRKPQVERLDKFKAAKQIIINVSMTQYSVVSEVAQQFEWKIQRSHEAGDWDVFWTDSAINPDVLIKMHLFQKINHYPGIHIIARKNLLGINLMSLREQLPDQYDFFPLTWMLPMQYSEFRAYYETKPKGKARTYIVKPEADCQGRGIFLTRRLQDLQNGKHYVIQRYLARPFLLDGLKFDMRVYVLLCGTNPLRLYLYQQGLARLATQKYQQPTRKNLERQYIHLTNYAINKRNPKFIFNANSKNMGVGHKRSLTAVFKQLAAQGLDVDRLKQKIKDVAIKTIVCGLPLMSHQYRYSQPQDYSGSMCFHVLGLDIMLDNKGDPVLLEVNHTPSFTTDTPLDHKIKYNLIKDTLTIMNVNLQEKNKLLAKAQEINKERLLTGKRQIYDGKLKEEAIREAQQRRDLFEDKHLGGYERIYPVRQQVEIERYEKIIEASYDLFSQQNGSKRMKMIEKQGRRFIKADRKMVKKEKQEPSQSVEPQKQSTQHMWKSDIAKRAVKSIPRIPIQNRRVTQTPSQLDSMVEEDEEDDFRPQNVVRSQRFIPVNEPVSYPKIAHRNSEAPMEKSPKSNKKVSMFGQQVRKESNGGPGKIKIMGQKCFTVTKTGHHKGKTSSAPHNPDLSNSSQPIWDPRAVNSIKYNRKILLNPKPIFENSLNAQLNNLFRRQRERDRAASRLINPRGHSQPKSNSSVARQLKDVLDRKSLNVVIPKLTNLSMTEKKLEYPSIFMPWRRQQADNQ